MDKLRTKEPLLHWYMLIYTEITPEGKVNGETMDLLAEGYAGAEALAVAVMEPGSQIESIAHMGTKEDYDIYDSYLTKRWRAKRQLQQVRSAATGDSKFVEEISPTSIPFSDDEHIELT